MGGYIQVARTQFIHIDDKCPNNCPEFEDGACCSSYDAATKNISTGQCNYHRNVNSNVLSVGTYGPGSVIHHDHLNILRNSILTELNIRRQHVWYSGQLSDLSGSNVAANDLIEHSQENVINECIARLNDFINNKEDYEYAKDGNVRSHRVETGDVIAAENLKYLERNLQASYQDCICYSDCTSHGLSSWIERVWCETYGSGGGY